MRYDAANALWWLLAGSSMAAAAASSNDPAVLGAWKGTGEERQWVINFLPNDVYQLRMGDSPTGSRGQYVAKGGKFELLEGNAKRKVMSGTYRVEDCKVLVLSASTGTARMNRSGTPPDGSCASKGSARPMDATARTAAAPPPAPAPRKATPVPTSESSGSKQAATGTPKPGSVSGTARQVGHEVAGAATEAGHAVKSGAVTLWDKTKAVTHKAVEAGGKAAKTVGNKAQEAGHAVAGAVRKTGSAEEEGDKPAP